MPKPALQQLRELRKTRHKFAFKATKFLHFVQDDRCIVPKEKLLQIEIKCHPENCPSAAEGTS